MVGFGFKAQWRIMRGSDCVFAVWSVGLDLRKLRFFFYNKKKIKQKHGKFKWEKSTNG